MQNVSQPVGKKGGKMWISFPDGPIALGELPNDPASPDAYDLAHILKGKPEYANVWRDLNDVKYTEILVYVWVATHNGPDQNADYKVSVRQTASGDEAAGYLHILSFNQAAWSYNSDNIWLPIPRHDFLLLAAFNGAPLVGGTAGHQSQVLLAGYR